MTLSVNVSGRQFRRPDFVDAFQQTVRDAGVDPRYVAVEVTEARDHGRRRGLRGEARRGCASIGIQIHVDDFGTGYSSLSYLHRFPITAVKIDRSFVAGLPGHPESEEVIKAIVSIAESLDFDVIAEGVETAASGGEARGAPLPLRAGVPPRARRSRRQAWRTGSRCRRRAASPDALLERSARALRNLP